MAVVVYISTVSSNMEIKKQQQRLEMILSDKKYNAEFVDIASSEELKQKMRKLMDDPKGLPPQIFNGDQYCGGYAAFDEAVEAEDIKTFLKL